MVITSYDIFACIPVYLLVYVILSCIFVESYWLNCIVSMKDARDLLCSIILVTNLCRNSFYLSSALVLLMLSSLSALLCT